jgi:hypothetical protein
LSYFSFLCVVHAGEISSRALQPNAANKDAQIQHCPQYLKDMNEAQNSTVQMLDVCQDLAKLPPEADDPNFLQQGLKGKFIFLSEQQNALAKNCAQDFAQSCPGGRGQSCKERLLPTEQQITGYYHLQSRMHDELSALQNELDYSDQLLKLAKVQPGVRLCDHMFSDLKANCAQANCKIAPDELERVSSELVAVAKKIESLEAERRALQSSANREYSYRHHIQKETVEKIKSLTQQINLLKAQYPITQGKAFKKYFKTEDPQTYH